MRGVLLAALATLLTVVGHLAGGGSVTAAPDSASASTAPFSITQTCSRAGSSERTEATVASCAAVSTTTARAPESDRIQRTCSAEEVS